MAWYNDPARKTYVATYKSDAAMRNDMENASRFGFMSQSMAQRGSEWTVSYVRDERAWARIQAQTALETLHAQQRDLGTAQAALPGLAAQVEAAFRAARTEVSDPVKLEQQLSKAVADVVTMRDRSISLRHALLAAHAVVKSTREEAARLQVDTQAAIDMNIDAEISELRVQIETEERRIAIERALQQAQQEVVAQVQPWKRIVGDRWGAHTRLLSTEKTLATVSAQQQIPTATDAADAPSPVSNPKVAAASAKHAKHQGALDELDSRLQQQEQALLQSLEARDQRMAAFSR